MRYRVKAYLCTNFASLATTLETDDFYEVQDFIEANCRLGYNCQLVDTLLGTEGWSYAVEYTDDDLHEDLLLEQHEQM